MDHRGGKMISVIIPVLNEEKALPVTLSNVLAQKGEFEIIVVDGGSQDKSPDIVRRCPAATLVVAERGRAAQMNVGAAHARGEFLLFLHADTLLPDNALLTIGELINQPEVQAGCFHQRFSEKHFLLRAISWLHNWRCNRSRIIYGDQAMFVRKKLFHQLGGFPAQPILEDVLFSELLVQSTRPVFLKEVVITDSRKFIQRGILRSFMEIFIIMSCYELRLPILAKGFFSPVR